MDIFTWKQLAFVVSLVVIGWIAGFEMGSRWWKEDGW